MKKLTNTYLKNLLKKEDSELSKYVINYVLYNYDTPPARRDFINDLNNTGENMNLKQFSEKCSLKILSYEPNLSYDKQDSWQQKANGYRLQLIHKASKRRYSFDFWQGTGIIGDPDLLGVLEYLQSDCNSVQLVQDGGGFDDFCDKFGYDSDSRKAEKLYKAICRERNAVNKLLGNEDYKEFCEIDLND